MCLVMFEHKSIKSISACYRLKFPVRSYNVDGENWKDLAGFVETKGVKGEIVVRCLLLAVRMFGSYAKPRLHVCFDRKARQY